MADRPARSAPSPAHTPRPSRRTSNRGWRRSSSRVSTAVVMEVSSHALELQRVVGLPLRHRGVHQPRSRPPRPAWHARAVLRREGRLFQPDLSDLAVVNIDDPHGRLLMDVGAIPTEGFGLGDVVECSVSATSHSYIWRGQSIDVPIGGEFNVMNSLAAATACARLGIAPATIAAGLARRERRCPVASRRSSPVSRLPSSSTTRTLPMGWRRRSARRVQSPATRPFTWCSAAVATGIARSDR